MRQARTVTTTSATPPGARRRRMVPARGMSCALGGAEEVDKEASERASERVSVVRVCHGGSMRANESDSRTGMSRGTCSF